MKKRAPLRTGWSASLLLLAFGCAHAPGPKRALEPREVTVAAQGEVRGRPDQARIVLGVETEAETAEAALAENSRRIEAVLGALTKLGVERADIQTTQISLHPQYVHPGPVPGREEAPRLVGYRAENQIILTTKQLEALGRLLDAGVRSGANRVSSLSFAISDPGALEEAARREAMQKAERAARALAELAGARLGPVLTIREGEVASPGPKRAQRAMLESRAMDVPVEPGELTVGYEVVVSYRLE